MAFFLIGKGPGDDLTLVSCALFATRQDAMAELSRLSAEPSFAHWDAEVAVVDLDAGLPVLLVRPQAAVPAPAQSTAAATEGGADSWIADLPAEPIAQPEPEAMPEAEADSVIEGGAPDLEAAPPASAEPEPAVAAAEPEASAPVAEAVEPSAAVQEPADSSDDLRAALQRTAEQMSAQGITPPPSAGLPWAPIAIGEALSAAGITANPLPDAESGAEDAAAPELEPATAETPAPPGAWPWSAGAPDVEAQSAAPDLDEAGAQDVYSTGSAADASVIEPPAQRPSQFDAVFAAPGQPATGAHEPMSAKMPEQPMPEPPEDESDFILDLDAIQPVAVTQPVIDAEPAEQPAPQASEPAASPVEPEAESGSPAADAAPEPAPAEVKTPAASAPAPESMPLTEYTCDDCVYVATCPNRDHRLPKDCGSFQWR